MEDKERFEKLKFHKCAEPNCYNYQARGFIYCIKHMYGSPSRMTEEDVAFYKGYKE